MSITRCTQRYNSQYKRIKKLKVAGLAPELKPKQDDFYDFLRRKRIAGELPHEDWEWRAA